jgi:hypothetical protein
MSSPQNGNQELSAEVNQALVTFIDFIYAVVFGLIVAQAYDTIINDGGLLSDNNGAKLLLLLGFSYFFSWDWILGRILTLRNPYHNYTRVFCEILVAACAYGTVSAILKGKLTFLLHFALLLFSGAIWAQRTEARAVPRDAPELCTIQVSQYFGTALFILLYFVWPEKTITWALAIYIVTILLVLVLVYEMWVPRPKGILGGPGMPFLARSDMRWIKRRGRRLVELLS